MLALHAKRAVLAVLPTAFLAACVSQSKYDALDQQNQQLQAQNQQLSSQVARLQNTMRMVVNDDLLFKSGSWQLSDDGKQTMARIAQQLAPFQTQHIVINGYTDNAPIGTALRQQGVDNNEMLSQKRAESVVAFLSTQGVRSDLMQAKGWGEADPIASNNTPAGRAQNRRVEITFATS